MVTMVLFKKKQRFFLASVQAFKKREGNKKEK
jgi:hypothetical protein